MRSFRWTGVHVDGRIPLDDLHVTLAQRRLAHVAMVATRHSALCSASSAPEEAQDGALAGEDAGDGAAPLEFHIGTLQPVGAMGPVESSAAPFYAP
jgi:hypothetical protein